MIIEELTNYLKIESVEQKADFEDGTTDMLSTVMVIEDKDAIPIVGQIIMDNATLCRMDIICRHFYGDLKLLDALMKFNNIVDPLAVPAGKIIYIPNRFEFESKIKYKKLEEPAAAARGVRPRAVSLLNNRPVAPVKESAVNKRSILNGRGVGYTVTAPGVIKF